MTWFCEGRGPDVDHPGARRWWRPALTMLAVAGFALGVPATAGARTGPRPSVGGGPVSAPAVDTGWPVYHADGLGDGVDPSGTVLTGAGPVWTSAALDGQIFGEPLEEDGLVIVATENDTVYALDATSGAVAWQDHLASPVPSGDLPCGDISPTVGITSTPVIDPSLDEVFVVADELTGTDGASHHLVGIDLTTGDVLLDTVVDPPGSHPLYQLQRPGLALDDGQVIIGYGGNAGDCEAPGNPYHGWLVAEPETGGPMESFEVAAQPGDSQGAIWMGGAAPVVDASGNIWVATGNSAFGSSGDTYDDSDGVLELSASLALEQSFAPSDWYYDNAHDFDLGSVAPALLADGLAFQGGKSHTGYLLSQSDLGGVGGELAQMTGYCGSTVDGGSAVVGNVVYAPCEAGIVATQLSGSPPSISVLWQTSTGAGSPPIYAGGLVWTMDTHNGYLYGLDPATGAVEQAFPLGTIANHFPTPSVGDGMLLAASADQVHAFASEGSGTPGSIVVHKTSGLVGNGADSVSGTAWYGNASVGIYQCASSTYAAASCGNRLAAVAVRSSPVAKLGTFPSTPFAVSVGTIDTEGDTCGLSTSGTCFVVAVGSSGTETSVALDFALPTATLHKTTPVVGNYLDAVAAKHFPVGDTVEAMECDAAVDPATNTATNCDPGTGTVGTAAPSGTVVFSPNGVTVHAGAAYQDGALGTCNPGATCDVVVLDETDTAIRMKIPFTLAVPSVTVAPTSVAGGGLLAVTARGFPIGDTVDALECDTTFTAGAGNHCDTVTELHGVANSTGTVAGTAWLPTVKITVLTATTATHYADSAGGSCAVNDTVANGDPCYVGTSDATNATFSEATAFSVT